VSQLCESRKDAGEELPPLALDWLDDCMRLREQEHESPEEAAITETEVRSREAARLVEEMLDAQRL
jgi:hypothetical protein